MIAKKRQVKWVNFVLVSLLLVVLAACSSNNSNGSPSTQTPEGSVSSSANNDEPIVITYSTYRAEDEQIFAELIAKFQDENPLITVKFETNKDTNAYYQTLKANLSSGKAPDVFDVHPNTDYITFVKEGMLADLSNEIFVKNYQEGPKALTTVDGKIYGFNHAINLISMIYNKEIFAKYSLEAPKDWNDFIRIMKTLKEGGEGGIAYAGGDLKGVWIFNAIANELMGPEAYKSFIEGIDSGALTTIKEVDGVYTALKTLSEYNKQQLLFTNSDGIGYPQSLSLLAQGKAPMVLMGTWTFGTKEADYPGIDVGIFPVPTLDGTDIGYAEPAQISTVFAKSKHIEAAKKWVNFLASAENAEIYANKAKMTTSVKNVNAAFTGADILAAQMEKGVNVIPIVNTPNVEIYQKAFDDLKVNILFKGADVDAEIAKFEEVLKKADLKNVK
ncbi:ABC transporter substrate-binding protein [Cohnella phaseoli]|uniref:Carbohydrate ABC transporter substrate-binding protein (CUT1 family) n=1 Tax=Cohnella phaseoli TaxID=456490 RepID=A0A3D9JTX1_9BACL|nr:extracellular solute-binding protein [Cohnella phaseoli]RED76896.1 carbohydrate ABC transporter substrate-binding protein (CUT1 family) [Cohnella phaseoli]